MKKLLAILWLTVSFAYAQDQSTPNLITNTWTGVTTGTLPTACGSNGSGGCAGGPGALYDPATNSINFSYGQATAAQTFAINQALANAGAGIQVKGYNYSWEINNLNRDNRQGSTDTLTATILTYASDNATVRRTDSWTYNTKFDWTTFSGTVNYTNPGPPSDFGNMTVSFSGKDTGFWGGYYGPQVRNVSLSMRYGVDPCATNPAYSPSCPNYNTVSTQSLWSGVTGPQAVAINQALSGSGVMVHGFDYGYNYSVGNRFCNFIDIFGGCLGSWVYPSASMTTTLTNNNGVVGFTETNTHGAGEVGSFSKSLRLGSSLPISTLGTFSMTPSTNNGAVINNIYGTVVYTADPCVTNPLSSTTCAGYQQAFLEQQCASNPLYSTQCAGYAVAYFNQQCSANALYNPSCPGYAAAYLNYQCSINPLYSTTCAGYETAYFNQQCSENALYNSTCPGYAQAYHAQQCSLNPLYATTCSGYADAYFSQQCNLNGLYDRTCPNYSTAYAKKMLLEQQNLASTVATAGVVAATAPVSTSTVSSDGTVSSTPSSTGSTTVDKAISAPTTTANAAAAPAAPVQLVAPAPKAEVAAAPAQEKKPEGGGPQQQMAQGPQGGGEKPQPTARQQLAERRAEAAKKDAVEKGKNLANDMGKAADMEAQKQVQNVVIQAMGFTPGFDAYNRAMVPDTVGYKPFTVYKGQVNVDNKKLGWGLYGPSDRLHNELVDSQYKGN